jgi:hypothetical protein
MKVVLNQRWAAHLRIKIKEQNKMAFKYVKRNSPRAKKSSGQSFKAVGKKPPLGSGKRFSALSAGLKAKGAKNPNALAAWIGRKVHGGPTMTKLSIKGKAKKR